MKIYGQLESAQLENLSSAPSAASRGRAYFDTTLSMVGYYTGSAWVYFAGTPSGTQAVTPRTVTGTLASPTSVVAGTGITPTAGGVVDELIFIKGTGGVTVTANPQIANGATVGQRISLKGTSDTDYVDLADGNGLDLSGDIRLGDGDCLGLLWNGTEWSEEFRR